MAFALILFAIGPINRAQYLRVWLAMIAGLPLAYLFTSPWAYIAIDLAVAAIVMVRPKAPWQRAIGFCYVGMALLTTGYMIRQIAGVYIFSSPAVDPIVLSPFNDFLGWAATLILIAWGGNGVFRAYRYRANPSGDIQLACARRVR
jgi:hypothetical protein